MLEIDLHGRTPDSALRHLGRELHAARVRGVAEVRVITGKGRGNGRNEPILRGRVERWLDGPDGRRLGVARVERTRDGGSLALRLGPPGR
jgi:DNA-nicking Smr family endonuclease